MLSSIISILSSGRQEFFKFVQILRFSKNFFPERRIAVDLVSSELKLLISMLGSQHPTLILFCDNAIAQINPVMFPPTINTSNFSKELFMF